MAIPARRIVRRIGAIIAITLVVMAIIIVAAEMALTQSYRLKSRTIVGRQFHLNSEWWENDLGTIRKFEMQQSLNPEIHNGLRLAIDEWPSWKYLISIDSIPDGTARGLFEATPYNGKRPTYLRSFDFDESEAKLFFDTFDRKIDGFWGATTQCTDGTGFQFERWRNKMVASGLGNAACQRHYSELMSLIAEFIVVKLKDAPFDWRAWFLRKYELRSSGNGT